DDPEIFLPWLSLLGRVGHALESLTVPGALPAAVDVPAHARAALEEVARDGAPASWGETHRLAAWQALPSVSPSPGSPALEGDHDCVMSSSSVPGLTDLGARASAARFVWDLARRQDSAWIVPLGASGLPDDAHARDQLPLWLRGALVPVVTDWNVLTEEESA
ncbi:penicillin acylase family protein, partial [Streptomyces sp. UH6]|uniref:penicillin acylase family protein n=1 Tax=Streptomyces sp. UH6 TaxID=2748379 RepID=UPI0015D4E6E2